VTLRFFKFRVSSFNPATCFANYNSWGLCFNFTFNFRCCCSTPRFLFKSVIQLPLCCQEEKQVLQFFVGYCRVAVNYQILWFIDINYCDNFCEEAVPLQKGCKFRSRSLQNELCNKPNHAAIWSNLIQSEIKDHYKKSCDKYHGHYKLPCHNVIISWKILCSSLSGVPLSGFDGLAFCRWTSPVCRNPACASCFATVV